MALRTIRVQGDPVLEKICKPVKELTPRTRELIEDMLDPMYEANGVGLAAPQVTYIMHDLKMKGFPVGVTATTVEEAADEIMHALGRQ